MGRQGLYAVPSSRGMWRSRRSETLLYESNRPLLLQSLPPLYFVEGLATNRVNTLPESLHPFFKNDERKHLPYQEEDRMHYNQLPRLILVTGGQP